MDKEAIASIIATARHHNPRLGITGLLVYGQGIFFQWLEGPHDNVTQLLARISADPRHTHVVVLSQEDEIRERLFPECDMEWVEAADIREVLNDALEQSSDDKQSACCRRCCWKSNLAAWPLKPTNAGLAIAQTLVANLGSNQSVNHENRRHLHRCDDAWSHASRRF